MVFDVPGPSDMFWVIAEDPDGHRPRRVYPSFGADGFSRGHRSELYSLLTEKISVSIRVMEVHRWDLFKRYLAGHLDARTDVISVLQEPARKTVESAPSPRARTARDVYYNFYAEEMIPCGTVRTAILEPDTFQVGGSVIQGRIRRGGLRRIQILTSLADPVLAPLIVVGDAVHDREAADPDIPGDVGMWDVPVSFRGSGPCVGYPARASGGLWGYHFIPVSMLTGEKMYPYGGAEDEIYQAAWASGQIWRSEDIRAAKQGKASKSLLSNLEAWERGCWSIHKELAQVPGVTMEEILQKAWGIYVIGSIEVPDTTPMSVEFPPVAGSS